MYSVSKKIDNVLEDVLSLDKSQFKIKLIKSLNKNDAAYEHVLNRLNRSPSIDLVSVDRIVTELKHSQLKNEFADVITHGETIQKKENNIKRLFANNNNINVDGDLIKEMKQITLELNALKTFYNENLKFRNLIDNLGRTGKRRTIKGTFATMVIGGGGMFIVEEILSSIVKNKNAKSGCWRTYTTSTFSKQKKECLILEASCGIVIQTGFDRTGLPICGKIPKIINEKTCEGWNDGEGSVCRSCNPLANGSKQFLPREEFVDPFDTYECKEPVDLLDVIVDVAEHFPLNAWEGIRYITDKIWTVLKIIFFVSLFFVVSALFYRFKNVSEYIKYKAEQLSCTISSILSTETVRPQQ